MNGPTISSATYSDETFGRVSKRAYLLAAAFLSLVPIALLVDLRVAVAASNGGLPGDIHRLINLSEVFAHGMGVAMICNVIWALDPHNRRSLVRIAVCAFGAGMLANVGKLIVARQRPNAFFLDTAETSSTVWDTFVGWTPRLSSMPDAGSHTIQSLPSAHTATAVAFALVLAWRYPKGRWLFALFAFLAACQRIMVGAHYLSDTLAGAAVGGLLIGLSFDRRLVRRFNQLRKRGVEGCDNEQPRSSRAA